jgi:hypothetical protein
MKRFYTLLILLVTFAASLMAADITHYGVNNEGYVDLGLPSGTLWANVNVGAESIIDAGDPFAWGEVETKETCSVTNYKWYNVTGWTGSSPNYDITKYNTSSLGVVDNKTKLDLIDDAAYRNWGGDWRMPTKAELLELIDNTTLIVTQIDGKRVHKRVAKNGNYIILPLVLRDPTNQGSAGVGGIWTSELSYDIYSQKFDDSSACGTRLTQGDMGVAAYGRATQYNVRPVKSGAPNASVKVGNKLVYLFRYKISFGLAGGNGHAAEEEALFTTTDNDTFVLEFAEGKEMTLDTRFKISVYEWDESYKSYRYTNYHGDITLTPGVEQVLQAGGSQNIKVSEPVLVKKIEFKQSTQTLKVTPVQSAEDGGKPGNDSENPEAPDTPDDDINVAVEEVSAVMIYAKEGTVYSEVDFEIYDLAGVNVTKLNGSLQGIYIVKTAEGNRLVSVW